VAVVAVAGMIATFYRPAPKKPATPEPAAASETPPEA
jgi:hypothetical protein